MGTPAPLLFSKQLPLLIDIHLLINTHTYTQTHKSLAHLYIHGSKIILWREDWYITESRIFWGVWGVGLWGGPHTFIFPYAQQNRTDSFTYAYLHTHTHTHTHTHQSQLHSRSPGHSCHQPHRCCQEQNDEPSSDQAYASGACCHAHRSRASGRTHFRNRTSSHYTRLQEFIWLLFYSELNTALFWRFSCSNISNVVNIVQAW